MATKKQPKDKIVKQSNSTTITAAHAQQAESKIIEGVQTLADILSHDQSPAMVANIAHMINVKLMEPLKKNLEVAKAILKEVVSASGEVSGKNGLGRVMLLPVPGSGEIKVEKRVAVHQSPDMAKFSELLRGKDLNPEDWCRQVVSYDYDGEKAGKLINMGLITEDELDSCRKRVESIHIEKV
jgi:hypothetical protein